MEPSRRSHTSWSLHTNCNCHVELPLPPWEPQLPLFRFRKPAAVAAITSTAAIARPASPTTARTTFTPPPRRPKKASASPALTSVRPTAATANIKSPVLLTMIITPYTRPQTTVPRLSSCVDHFTAIRMKHLASHVRRIRGCQKHKRRRHLFRLPGPLHRHVGAKRRDLVRFKRRRNERRPNRSRRDAVHANPLIRQRQRERSRETRRSPPWSTRNPPDDRCRDTPSPSSC